MNLGGRWGHSDLEILETGDGFQGLGFRVMSKPPLCDFGSTGPEVGTEVRTEDPRFTAWGLGDVGSRNCGTECGSGLIQGTWCFGFGFVAIWGSGFGPAIAKGGVERNP